MKKILVLMLACFVLLQLDAQKMTPEEYVAQYKDLAVREMKRMGVPAAITLAQGILETESGNSELLKKSNNHFGIKCKSTWTSGGVSHDDDAAGECFRQYKTAEDSYRDHSNFLRGNDRYAFLFRLDAKDYKAWSYGLKKAGYATNPAYPQILIKNIEQYNLNQYTLEGMDELPVYDGSKYQSDPEVPETRTVVKDTPDNTAAGITPVTTMPANMPEGIFKIDGKKVLYCKKGTSLLKIANDNNIRLVKLMEYNELKEEGLLTEDRIIYLEKKPAGAVTTVSTSPVKQSTASVKKHIVQPKEGLYAISKKYGVTVQQIREWNNLQSDVLSIGQELVVSR